MKNIEYNQGLLVNKVSERIEKGNYRFTSFMSCKLGQHALHTLVHLAKVSNIFSRWVVISLSLISKIPIAHAILTNSQVASVYLPSNVLLGLK